MKVINSMNAVNAMKTLSKGLFYGFLTFAMALTMAFVMAGCSGGGGGGGGGGVITPPLTSVHTEFAVTPAYVRDYGVPYTAAVSVWETRGDPVDLNLMRTYRTWADSSNSGKTSEYFFGEAGYVYGWMFDSPTSINGNIRDAVIYDNSTVSSRNIRKLQGYERRTITTSVMVGKPYQSRPAGFDGIFITNSQYKEWIQANHPGIKFWIKLEGYDYRLVEDYNIYLPLEIRFEYNPYDPTTGGTGTNTGGNTDPYDDPTNPYDPFKSVK